MYDLCAIGDALVDYIPTSQYTAERPVYQCETGGTVANLLAAGAKLGMKTLLVGKIGNDCMGQLIYKSMKQCGVCMRGCVWDPVHFTTQSFVSLDEKGERSFSFSRRFGADIYLESREILFEEVFRSSLVEFSSMCMTDEPIRTAAFGMLEKVYEENIPIVFDLNYRHNLWKSEDEMIRVMKESLKYVTLYKSSEEEAELLTGKNDLKEMAEDISGYGCKCVVITLGEQGSFYYMEGQSGVIPSWKVEAVDTTGAGDSFFAGLLYQITKRGGIGCITPSDLPDMMRFANAAGALTTLKRGGLSGASSLQEVENFLKTVDN